MKILIVDDEAPARARLRSLIDDSASGTVVGQAANGAAALKLAAELEPDVVLLDIRMPGMDGLEAAMHLSRFDNPPAVIFTTAYGDHALHAFQAQAIDYLLKPVRAERLAQALDRAGRLNRAQLLSVSATTGERRTRTHISVRRTGAIELIPVADIRYFRADQKYVVVYHARGEALIDESLKTLADEFAGEFLRIHRKYLVAKSCLAGLESRADGRHEVILRHPEERLPVSRRLAPDVKQALKALATAR